MTTIRPMHRNEASAVRDLWHEMCHTADASVSGGWGRLSPESLKRIRQNLERTPAHPDALCLVVDDDGDLVGFVTASLVRHPVMPGKVGEIEELYVRSGPRAAPIRDQLIEEVIDWFDDQSAGVIMSRIALDTPWMSEHVASFTDHGFENDQTLVVRYHTDPAQSS